MTVVLLHPVGLDGECWQFITAPRFANAIRYDMLWHGCREQPAAPLSMATFAADILARVAGPLDLVGVSMGGSVAQEIALKWPDRVRSIVIACSSVGGGGGLAQNERAETTEKIGMAGMLDSTLQRWFTPAARELVGHPGIAYARQRLLSDSPQSFAAAWRALAAVDTAQHLHRIAAPTTVLHAEQDASVSLERNQAMAAAIPGARLKVIPGPHMVHLEQPQEFEAAVSEHLDWVDTQLNSGERRVT
jgi:pimeloyl-ACP methyl ester carboxylesterase